MAKHPFSRAVLRGAVRSGFTADALATAAKLTSAQLKFIRAGDLELTSRQKRAVEQLTGKTCGQLAASDLEPHGGPLTELMDMWADAVPVSQPSMKSAAAKRARV